MDVKDVKVQVFTYKEKTPIRTILQNGEPWWVLADVCHAIKLNNNRAVAARLDANEKRKEQVHTQLGKTPRMTIVNKPGLISAVTRSHKQEAKDFIEWLTKEVFPALDNAPAHELSPQTAASYLRKPASVNEVTRLIQTIRSVMKDSRCSPNAIAEAVQTLCAQFGIQLPENFGKKPVPPIPTDQLSFILWTDVYVENAEG